MHAGFIANKIIIMHSFILNVTISSVLFGCQAFTVDFVNITDCGDIIGAGDLFVDIDPADFPDQLVSGSFSFPWNLDETTFIEYQSYAWADGEWKFLFNGTRSLCNSVVDTITYKKFRTKVQPNLPESCPILAGDYVVPKIPASGQYVVLNTIKYAAPLVKHRIILLVDAVYTLCKDVYTITNL